MKNTKLLKKLEKKKSKSSKKKLIISAFLIIFAFTGAYLIYFIMQITLNTYAPLVVVVSGSMEPNINVGDLLFVQGVNPEEIKAGTIEDMDGDVIVYDAHGIWDNPPIDPIVHRVVDKWMSNGKWYFTTKGDANSYIDRAPVPEDNIIGVVIGRIPYLGWVKIFLTNTGLLIPLIVILSILLVISIVYDLYKGEEPESKTGKETLERIDEHKNKTSDDIEKKEKDLGGTKGIPE